MRWRTSACSPTPAASPRSGPAAVRSRAQREVYLVVERDAVVPRPRDLGLFQPGPVHRAGPQLRQPEPAALVEAERVDVVVGGGGVDLVAAEVPRRSPTVRRRASSASAGRPR